MTAWENVTNVTFDEIEIGATATLTHMVSQTDIELVALVSGDVDPFHLEGEGAADVRPDITATHAIGAGPLLYSLLGTKLPGPGMEIVRQDLKFQGAVRAGDRLTATVTAGEKLVEGATVVFDCRCTNQESLELISGTITVVAPVKRITYAEVAPPQLELRTGDAFVHLFRSCETLPVVPCAVVHPCDRDSLLGAIVAARRGIIEPILVGAKGKILAVAEAEGFDLTSYRIIDVEHSHAAAERGVELARAGEVKALMKGSLHTDELMTAVVNSATGLRTERRISHVFVMDVPAYPKALLITDAAVNIYPTLEDKVDIVQNAIDLAHVLEIDKPKVAILSAVEIVNPKIKSTIEAAALCKMADRGQITGGILDGPLAFDNAINIQAAQTKHIISSVAGLADILVVPDIEAGNMLAKQLAYFAGAEEAGIVLGTRVPIVLTSRADSVRSRLASTALMALVAHAQTSGTAHKR